jgi:hypothetical protein
MGNCEVATVNYTGLIPYTIKAIQELDEKDSAIDAKIAAKDAAIADLIAEIQAMKARLDSI